MRLSLFGFGCLVACLLGGTAARAFTIENKDDGQFSVPKFNLEEQAKGFSKDAAASADSKNMYTSPFGSGSVQFGASQGPYNFSSFGQSSFGPSTQNSRQEFDRRLAPPSSLEYNSLR